MGYPTKDQLYCVLYEGEGCTQTEAAEIFDITVGALRKLMEEYGVESRNKSDARKFGNTGEPNDIVPNVNCLPEIIEDLDWLTDDGSPPTTIDEAEKYIEKLKWRMLELEFGGSQKSSSMITPEMILAIIKAKKWRDDARNSVG